jgi:hypothetical protein
MDEKELYRIYYAAALAGLATKMPWVDACHYADLAARKGLEQTRVYDEELI